MRGWQAHRLGVITDLLWWVVRSRNWLKGPRMQRYCIFLIWSRLSIETANVAWWSCRWKKTRNIRMSCNNELGLASHISRRIFGTASWLVIRTCSGGDNSLNSFLVAVCYQRRWLLMGPPWMGSLYKAHHSSLHWMGRAWDVNVRERHVCRRTLWLPFFHGQHLGTQCIFSFRSNVFRPQCTRWSGFSHLYVFITVQAIFCL